MRAPGRISVDASLSWQATDNLRASLSVVNLNDSRHIEFDELAIERSAYFRLAWTL